MFEVGPLREVAKATAGWKVLPTTTETVNNYQETEIIIQTTNRAKQALEKDTKLHKTNNDGDKMHTEIQKQTNKMTTKRDK